jgi:hypothetical protein
VITARAFTHQAQFYEAVDRLELPSQVRNVSTALGTDWGGEPAVFFELVLADGTFSSAQAGEFTRKISHEIIRQIRPLEDWGVLPYFDFPTQSEHARMAEPLRA